MLELISPVAALSIPDSKKVSFTAGLIEVDLQSPAGRTAIRGCDLPYDQNPASDQGLYCLHRALLLLLLFMSTVNIYGHIGTVS